MPRRGSSAASEARAGAAIQDRIALIAVRGAWLVFGATFAARPGLAVPAAPLFVLAGALAVTGQIGAVSTVALALLGNLLGDAA